MLAFSLAKQFLFSKKQERFISVNAFLAIGSVALSVLVLLVVIAVMTGFGVTLREKIMTMAPHLMIYGTHAAVGDYEAIRTIVKGDPDVIAASPYIQGNAVLQHENKLYGIAIRGIFQPEEYEVIDLPKYLKSGTTRIQSKEIVIGTELAKTLNVKLGDEVTIMAAGGFEDENFPDEITFTIVGIYECGLHDYDIAQTFMTVEDARLLYGFYTEVHGIGITVKNPENVQEVKKRLSQNVREGLTLRTWLETNKVFFSALKSEKNMMFILLSFAILIASLNIVSTLVMLVMEKTKDIGILKAIGFPKRMIMKIFLLQGTLIGILGITIGTACGLVFIRHIDKIEKTVSRFTGYDFFPEDAYYFGHIPTHLTGQDIGIIVVFAFLFSVFAALYPAMKAAGLHAVEALRHE
ncbi:MAG: ABC transporter permease [Candidatus Aureabacteria bacterium]|nr:ABC transporter permease [Candidatus Auribacterota bacterium]